MTVPEKNKFKAKSIYTIVPVRVQARHEYNITKNEIWYSSFFSTVEEMGNLGGGIKDYIQTHIFVQRSF